MRHIWLVVMALAILVGPRGAEGKREVKKNPNPIVVMKTNLGTVKIELNAEKAPVSVENFLGYVKDRFYDETVFHRVIKGFMIQGGGFDKAMGKKPTKKAIINEAQNGLKNTKGTIAMARTKDPNSATAQFFISTVDNTSLDWTPSNPGYAVFGRVIEGMDVVQKIEASKTAMKAGMNDVPVDTVIIESIRLAE